MNKLMTGVLFTFVGIVAGAGSLYLYSGKVREGAALSAEQSPLYWVAPMDASYRSDAPGKSPMGMDLVPVYEQATSGGAGVVSIDPRVVNNLGVRTAAVAFGSLDTNIRTVGYVGFDEDSLIHMHPRVEGWIETLNVKTQGEHIKAGQPIYSIYSPTLVNAQEELVLALERNNQRLIQSAEEKLVSLQVPQTLIDKLKADKKVMQNIVMFAPRDGIVAELGVRHGQFVQPGNPIISIGVLDEVWVMAEVFERQIALVQAGDEVSMHLDYFPGREWQGEVDFIYPTLNEKTRTVAVRIRVKNADLELKPNMFAQVTIHSINEQSALLVPNEAIIKSGTQDRVVLAMDDGHYKSIEVNLGRRGESQTKVLSGLEDGDMVVTSAQFLLDSESSISSDFMRMGGSAAVMGAAAPAPSTTMNMAMDNSSSEEASDSIWTKGVVERKMSAQMMTVTHEPIPDWDWPSMTMMFDVAEGVDISAVEIGSTVEVEITKRAGGQRITGVRTPE